MKRRFCLIRIAIPMTFAALTLAIGCRHQPAGSEGAGWDSFVSDFIESYFVAHPDFAVATGRHEFDGKLPDWSSEALAREVSRLKSQRQRALAFDSTTLDDGRRFERDFLLARIDRDLFWLETAAWPYRDPTFYSDRLDPNVYVVRAYAPPAQRLRAYVAYAKAVPRAAAQIRSNLRTPLPRSYVERGRTAFGGLASYYAKEVSAAFASVDDLQLQMEFRVANEEAVRAMKELEQWFEQQRSGATEAFAMGPDLFLTMLQETEKVDVPLDRLEAVGRQDMDRNLAALRQACRAYAPGKTILECIAGAGKTKPAGSVVERATRQLKELKAFVLAKGLVTIPGTEEALVAEAPPYRRANFAYIQIPGPYEKELPSVYYVAPPDPFWSKVERDAYIPAESRLLFTSAHEVWPGHFLERMHSKRSRSKLAQVFTVSTAFSEGWAHYAEEVMWEAGLGGGDPEVHIGQLSAALMRNVRYLSAIGLHAKGMTLEQSERMFMEAAHQDAGTARQQAARGTYDPAYLSYTLGKLMIRKLREDWTAARGGRDAWRQFHDEFLSYGRAPIPLIRKAMLGTGEGMPF